MDYGAKFKVCNELIDHYPVRLRFATARHPNARKGTFLIQIPRLAPG
ncbi:MAG: hypothetical protein LBB23_03520 [Rickettsiales bacterium]|nr:hypothetical protein [Rickettsiales bacterium]